MQAVGKRASPVRENQGSLQNLAETPESEIFPEPAAEHPAPEFFPEPAVQNPVTEIFPESAAVQNRQMKDHRLFLKVHIFQEIIMALIDTGAARTCSQENI